MLHNKQKQNAGQGYTLVEITVVLVIIGVITSFALPRFLTSTEKVKSGEGLQILDILRGSQIAYRSETGSFASSISSLDVTIPTSNNFNAPTISTTDPIASIQRKSSYTLTITEDGVVTCSGGPSGLCAKIGY